MPDSLQTFDTPTKRILPFILATAIFMQMLDSTILNTSLPSIAADLNESPLNMQNAIISYVLTLALFMPVSGFLADKFGTKKVFIFAILVFSMGSLFCPPRGQLGHGRAGAGIDDPHAGAGGGQAWGGQRGGDDLAAHVQRPQQRLAAGHVPDAQSVVGHRRQAAARQPQRPARRTRPRGDPGDGPAGGQIDHRQHRRGGLGDHADGEPAALAIDRRVGQPPARLGQPPTRHHPRGRRRGAQRRRQVPGDQRQRQEPCTPLRRCGMRSHLSRSSYVSRRTISSAWPSATSTIAGRGSRL